MNLKHIVLGAALACAAAPAAAAQPGAADDDDEQFGTWLSIEVAPSIISDGPFRADSPTTDSTDISWTLRTVQPLGDHLAFELRGGPTATVDSDDDAEARSALAASLKIRSRTPFSGFTPFASYGIELGYDDFFDARAGTGHTFQAGVEFVRESGPLEFTFETGPTLVESTQALSDYWAVPASIRVDYALVPDRVGLITKVAAERRWYRDVDPTILAERRDWRFQAYAGIDLAGEFNRLIGHGGPDQQSFFSELGFGVRWIETRSNLDGEDESDVNFLPLVSIEIEF